MSISILISYIVLGLTLAAPVGPVNSARIDKGIKHGFWHSWVVGVGSMIADGSFMFLVYLGMVQFLEYPIVQVFLWLFGGFVLIYSGVESLIGVNSVSLTRGQNKKESLFKCFFTGFIMSATSPISIMFWLAIYGSVLAKTAEMDGSSMLLLYSSMIFIGLALWDIFVAALTTGFRRFLNDRMLKAIAILSGLSLIGFGVYFGYHGLKELFGW